MTDQQKTLGRLLAESFSLFSGNILKLTAVTFAVYLPLEATTLLVFKWLDIGQVVNLKYFSNGQLWGYIIIQCVTTFFLFLYQIAFIKTVESADKKENFTLQGSYQKAFALFGSCLCVIGLVILKVFLWSLLFLVPGIIFGILYSFANLAFIVDGKKGKQALIYSKQLVKPAIWRLMGNLLVIVLVIAVLNIFIVLITMAAFGQNTGNYFEFIPAVGSSVTRVITTIIGGYASAFYYFLYKELKSHQEVILTEKS